MLWTYFRTRSRIDEPSAHPWQQISIDSCLMGTHFRVNAGIQEVFPTGYQALPGNPASRGTPPHKALDLALP